MPSTSNTTVVTVAMAQGLASTIVTLVCSGRNMKEITLVNLKIARRNEGKGKTNPTESGPFGLQNSLSNKHKLRLNTYSERERERNWWVTCQRLGLIPSLHFEQDDPQEQRYA